MSVSGPGEPFLDPTFWRNRAIDRKREPKGASAWANGVTKGDIAILTFLAAVETIEADLWLQYAELGGVQDNEIPGLPTGGSALFWRRHEWREHEWREHQWREGWHAIV